MSGNIKKKLLLPNNWTITSVGESFEVIGGGTPSTEIKEYWKGNIPWITSADIEDINNVRPRRFVTQEAINNSTTNLIPAQSIIVVTRVGLGKLVLAPYSLCISQDSQALIPKSQKFNTKFALYYLSKVAKSFTYQGRGTTVAGITKQQLKEIALPIPPLPEQNKIAAILSTWDRAVERTQRLIEARQRLKKYFMRYFLTGNMRFPGFQGEWQNTRLGQFLHPKLRKVVKPQSAYKRLGIRSHGKGTFISTVDDPDTISMTHLYKVKQGDLVVNITFAWEGAIALVGADGDGALVSHRFPSYIFDTTKMLSDFIKYLMVTKRFFYDLDLISPGGAGRNRVLNKTDFLKISVMIPGIEEQKKIAGILYTLDKQTSTLQRYLAALENQKRGLMQKLLAGEIRVKVKQEIP